ncbi:hypothetical protein VQH23_07575 [Pararoseomonas sp. SCSIO 73927]|uniref:hypothetical protein n=1 Tax=Pararoseomonas sp. SCSIO 73927 TaxID=3114537 RepID=UPI0030D374D8
MSAAGIIRGSLSPEEFAAIIESKGPLDACAVFAGAVMGAADSAQHAMVLGTDRAAILDALLYLIDTWGSALDRTIASQAASPRTLQ